MTRKLGFLFACALTPALSLAGCDLEKDDGTGGSGEELDTGKTDSDSEGETGGETEGEDESDSASGTTSVGSTTDPTDPEPPPSGDCNAPIHGLNGALSIRYDDVPPYEPGPGGSGSDTGDSDGGPDPDSIVIELSNATNSCDETSPLLACGGHWGVTIVLPPAMQAPGTYSLWDDLGASFTFADELHEDPFDEEDCAWGGGSFDGTLEIISIDENGIEGRLCDTDSWDFVADGTFSAPQCS